ncbi:GNAT family N-acetyltransferase [Nocardioides sp.]|uniref:NUDIX hydrolase n=1 Tax=Nocardioides sp. TaxID=35761 RepID=UPI003517FB1F
MPAATPGTPPPVLTDGVVTLRPWRDTDAAAAHAGHDEHAARWSDAPVPDSVEGWHALVAQWRVEHAEGRRFSFVIEAEDAPVGVVELEPTDAHSATLSYWLHAGRRGRGFATRGVRVAVDWALSRAGEGGGGFSRVEAHLEPGNESSLRVATRSGLQREGLRRIVPGTGARAAAESYVVLARLATDPPLTDPGAFRTLLNSFLPRKRAIGQMLVCDAEDRVLLCQLTYKRDWDLPGGVVEVGESPRLAVSREVEEELGLDVPAGALLLTDWLPPWGGWDDAVCLVFDGGTHPASLVDAVVKQAREIRDARFCTLAEVEEHCADFTARRIRAALEARRTGRAAYTESGA